MSINTPILFLIFNRPDTTQKVFEAIRYAKPKQLFVAADGPRTEEEKILCEQTRKIITDNIDWDCEVKTLFRDKNLGCKKAVSSAISWFFENVEEGIILEDDCLPSKSFFKFCENMLEKYRDNHKIMLISGANFQDGITRGNASYYYSKNCHIWGWASWRRVWQKYDIEMKTFPEFVKNNKIKKVFSHPSGQWYWLKMLARTYKGEIDTWDYQFNYTIWSNDGISVIPNKNLVSNIGFGKESTHTNFDKEGCVKEREEMNNIVHPQKIIVDKNADEYTLKNHYKINLSYTKAFVRKLLGKNKIKLG